MQYNAMQCYSIQYNIIVQRSEEEAGRGEEGNTVIKYTII